MSLVAEFDIEGDTFPLGRIVGDGVGIEFERVVPTDPAITPTFWVDPAVEESDRALAALESRLADHDAVAEFSQRAALDGRVLYRLRWTPGTAGLFTGLSRADATVRSVTAGSQWSVRARFPGQDHVSAFSDYCEANGVEHELARLVPLSASDDGFDITPAQREALVRAVEGGYFDVPRGMTLSELADDLDISKQAASERVRRAAGAVLDDVL